MRLYAATAVMTLLLLATTAAIVGSTPDLTPPDGTAVVSADTLPKGMYLRIDTTWRRYRLAGDTAWHYTDPVLGNLLERLDRENVARADSIELLKLWVKRSNEDADRCFRTHIAE